MCLQDWESIEELKKEGFPLSCGTIGENLTVQNLSIQKLASGTVLEFSGGVVLELTKPRNPCYVLDAIDCRLQSAIAGRCGFYARVVKKKFLTTQKAECILMTILRALKFSANT